jgi:hypothetical protein
MDVTFPQFVGGNGLPSDVGGISANIFKQFMVIIFFPITVAYFNGMEYLRGGPP